MGFKNGFWVWSGREEWVRWVQSRREEWVPLTKNACTKTITTNTNNREQPVTEFHESIALTGILSNT